MKGKTVLPFIFASVITDYFLREKRIKLNSLALKSSWILIIKPSKAISKPSSKALGDVCGFGSLAELTANSVWS